MRLQLISFLFLLCSFCQGQSVADSVLSKEWRDDFNSRLYFENGDLVHEMENDTISIAQFGINDTVILLGNPSGKSWQVKYEYFTDSLVLYSNRFVFAWSDGCWPRIKTGNEHWVYYSADYLNKKPFAFEKLQIKDRKGLLEIDNDGHIFFATTSYKNYYGHYRGKLSDNQLKKFTQLTEAEDFKIKRLACRHTFSSSTHVSPALIKYHTTSRVYITGQYLDDLKERGYKTFDFIIENVAFEKLKFQNYADGDSVAGVVIYQLPYRNSQLFEVQPTYLTKYDDRGEEFYLYKGFIDSVHAPDDSTTRMNYTQRPMYFYSDTLINTESNVLIETEHVGEDWFSRGRAFQKPERMIFRQHLSHKELPPNHKAVARHGRKHKDIQSMVVRSIPQQNEGLFKNPFPKSYRTRFGLPYPFLRPPFQVAFEEYVLPDWEEYLKKQIEIQKK